MARAGGEAASLTLGADGAARLEGALGFATVAALLPAGERAILAGEAAVIDLAGVTSTDSAGLALLVEWLSIARAASRPLSYRHVPAALRHLARLSEVEPLLDP